MLFVESHGFLIKTEIAYSYLIFKISIVWVG